MCGKPKRPPLSRPPKSSAASALTMMMMMLMMMTLLLGFFCCVSAQDTSSYYFPSQNRFVPSSASFPRQQSSNGFITGGRATNTASSNGFSPAPGSYQEQLLFIGNENNKQSPVASSGFVGSPFGANSQFAKPPSNRQTDFYDISPRPFGVPAAPQTVSVPAAAVPVPNGFTRSKAYRGNSNSNSNSLSGGNSLNSAAFQTPQRVNVPHQQTQFLAHFSEPTNDKRLTGNSFGSNSASSRPFGSGGFSPSGTRSRVPIATASVSSSESPASSQSSAYRPRSRFQPHTQTTSSTTAASTSTSAEVTKRFNRFGSNRGASKSTTTTTTTTQNTPADRPSFGRKGSSQRRPVFISREVNEPVNLVKRRPFDYNSARLKLNRPTPSTTSTTESQEDSEEYEVESQELLQQVEESSSLEKLPLQEEAVTPGATETKEISDSGEANKSTTSSGSNEQAPVILTSNFYLPDGSRANVSQSQETSSTSAATEAQTDSSEGGESTDVTTVPPSEEYEYEYSEDAETATTALSKETESSATEDQSEAEASGTTELPQEPSTTQSTTTTTQTTPAPISKETEGAQKDAPVSSKQEEEAEYEDEGEYEYEDGEGEDYEGEEGSEGGKSDSPDDESSTSKEQDGRQIISVVTTKSVINGSTSYPAPVTPSSRTTPLADSQPAPVPDLEEQTEASVVETTTPTPSPAVSVPNVTESYVVVASIQTSRSINGARFLPFPAIEQEETKQTLSELERKVHSKQQQKQSEPEPTSESEEQLATTTAVPLSPSSSTSTTTERSVAAGSASSTEESIIDKLDRVQSELSSGLLSGKYPIISQMDASTPATSTTTGSGTSSGKFVPHIRKFQPRTTSAPSTTSSGNKLKVQHFDESEMDELAGLLPVGFKPKSSYKNRKITTSTTTTTAAPELPKKPARNSTISRSFKNGVVTVQDVALSGLLPKGYKPSRTTATTTTTTESTAKAATSDLESLFSGIKFDDNLAGLLPKDYKPSTTPQPAVTLVDDLSKFLPPGYKLSTTEAPVEVKKDIKIEPNEDEVLKLLPPGYKAKPVHPASTTSTTTTSTTTAKPGPSEAPANSTSGGGPKVVFPKGFHKRLGAHRLTTPHTPSEQAEMGEGPSSPPVVIKKGPPTRATTEFTGWPTPPTTPLSVEKILLGHSINFEDLLTASASSSTTSSTTTTSTTTTTTTTTPRPTQPGHCTVDCDLAATIKIIDGVAWKPELLDHNTVEWKNLAHELEAQLNEVYANAPQLNKWYKKVRIDSFSKGSVLVDYYVELANITEDVNTLEIRQLFHEALTEPTKPLLPDKPEQENETDSVAEAHHKEEQLVRASYQMGKYIIDPIATDFSVIAKKVEFIEEDQLIPQWAIVVIVIGVGSLVFVVIFGVTVLLNRQKRAKKAPIPLTNDMLNELKVNHMSGADNYGVDDFYNIDDPWNDTKQPIKPKRFTNSMHGSNSSNIYDSWRSTRHPHSSGDYYYDQQPTFSQKGDSLKRPQHHQSHSHHHHQQYPVPSHQQQQAYAHQYPDAFADAHQMYSYNNHASSRTRYARDYDPDF